MELRHHLEGYLRAEILRRSWIITYTIQEIDPEYLRLTTFSQFEMENCSNASQEYTFYYFLEDSIFDIGDAKIIHASAEHVGAKRSANQGAQPEVAVPASDDSFYYSDDNLGGYIKLKNRGQEFSKIVEMSKHSTWRFSTESVEYFREGFASPFFANQPVLSTKLIVYYPQDKLEIFIDLSIGDIETDAQRIPHSQGMEWVLNKPLLPGQGFSTRIVRKKPAKSVASASAPEAGGVAAMC